MNWVYVPSQFDYIGLTGDEEYIYECFDNYAEFKFHFINRHQVVQYDQILAKNAFIVFTTAKKLYEDKIKINSRSYYIPNAVNIELFKNCLIEFPNKIMECLMT